MAGDAVAAELLQTGPDKGVDGESLAAFLEDKLPWADASLNIRQFSGGNANLLYLLTYPDAQYVLRRPPFGKLAPGSHDMSREYRVLKQLHPVYPLAPGAFLYCKDIDVIGAPFLVMEYRPSIVIRRELPDSMKGDAKACRFLGETIIDSLADLHSIDPVAVGLADLGNPEGYLERQMSGWRRRWGAAAEGPRADIERIMKWLDDSIPKSGRSALLHNDFKLDNMLLAPDDPTRCIGVVDWDMCTRGDPLVELGFLLNYWGEAGDPPEWLEAASMPTWFPGFPTRKEAVERYGARIGIPLDNLLWYRVFGAFRLAVILQQIWVAYARGERKNQRFATFGQRIDALIRKADRLRTS